MDSFEHRKLCSNNTWLDLCRSLAIILVILGHGRRFLVDCYPWAQWFKFGSFLGVELFFVLSGFLIGRILLQMPETNRKEWVKVFYFRRWLRTVPNYYLFLGVNILLAVWLIREASPFNFFEYLTFSQNFFRPSPHFFSESWSLCIEELFYFFFPLLMIGATRVGKFSTKQALLSLGLFVICASMALRCIVAPDLIWEEVRRIASLRFDGIMLGVVLSYFHEKQCHLLQYRSLKYMLSGLFLLISFYVAIMPIQQLNHLWFAKTFLFNFASLSCAGVILLGISWNFHHYVRRFLYFLAKLSYSAYLVNLPLYYVIVSVNQRYAFSPWTNWGLFISSVLLASYLIYHLYEKRFLVFRDSKVAYRKTVSS